MPPRGKRKAKEEQVVDTKEEEEINVVLDSLPYIDEDYDKAEVEQLIVKQEHKELHPSVLDKYPEIDLTFSTEPCKEKLDFSKYAVPKETPATLAALEKSLAEMDMKYAHIADRLLNLTLLNDNQGIWSRYIEELEGMIK
jgi:hypothetical protein